jgi:2-hydroxychromene-2-carboxylate isomerase
MAGSRGMVSAMVTLDFWYDFASTYSYLTAARGEAAAKAAGVELRWRPFLLGPIFRAQGWETSPFVLYPARGTYMLRDLDRHLAALGLPELKPPQQFPSNGLLAARAALALGEPARPAFTRAIYHAEFAEGRDIAERGVVAGALTALGHDAEATLARTAEPAIKDKLRGETEEAARLGIFGAPTFVAADREMFWGNDRFEQALAWARR